MAQPNFSSACLEWDGGGTGPVAASASLEHRETIERGGASKQLGGAAICFHLHEITALFDPPANLCRHVKEPEPKGGRFHQPSGNCCGQRRSGGRNETRAER